MKLIKNILLLSIKAYQFCISPYIGMSCKFYPTCSIYAYQAINSYGVLKGSYLSLKRILRCNPFSSGGFDPIP